MRYIACDGQVNMAQIGYSPLPPNLSQEIANSIARMQGGGAAPNSSTPANCSNPRFHGSLGAGPASPQDPLRNVVAASARAGGGGAAGGRRADAAAAKHGDGHERRGGRLHGPGRRSAPPRRSPTPARMPASVPVLVLVALLLLVLGVPPLLLGARRSPRAPSRRDAGRPLTGRLGAASRRPVARSVGRRRFASGVSSSPPVYGCHPSGSPWRART